jgi:hypothetical protein
VADPINELRDRVARQDEHSHVEATTREHIRAMIEAGDEREDLTVTARRVVDRLTPDELADIVADWLDTQTAT